MEASLLCFPSVFLSVFCVILLLSYNNYCSCATIGSKTRAKKSSEKKKKLITIEIKEIIDKHEKGTRVVDLPNNNDNSPPPQLHRLLCTQIIPFLR